MKRNTYRAQKYNLNGGTSFRSESPLTKNRQAFMKIDENQNLIVNTTHQDINTNKLKGQISQPVPQVQIPSQYNSIESKYTTLNNQSYLSPKQQVTYVQPLMPQKPCFEYQGNIKLTTDIEKNNNNNAKNDTKSSQVLSFEVDSNQQHKVNEHYSMSCSKLSGIGVINEDTNTNTNNIRMSTIQSPQKQDVIVIQQQQQQQNLANVGEIKDSLQQYFSNQLNESKEQMESNFTDIKNEVKQKDNDKKMTQTLIQADLEELKKKNVELKIKKEEINNKLEHLLSQQEKKEVQKHENIDLLIQNQLAGLLQDNSLQKQQVSDIQTYCQQLVQNQLQGMQLGGDQDGNNKVAFNFVQEKDQKIEDFKSQCQKEFEQKLKNYESQNQETKVKIQENINSNYQQIQQYFLEGQQYFKTQLDIFARNIDGKVKESNLKDIFEEIIQNKFAILEQQINNMQNNIQQNVNVISDDSQKLHFQQLEAYFKEKQGALETQLLNLQTSDNRFSHFQDKVALMNKNVSDSEIKIQEFQFQIQNLIQEKNKMVSYYEEKIQHLNATLDKMEGSMNSLQQTALYSFQEQKKYIESLFGQNQQLQKYIQELNKKKNQKKIIIKQTQQQIKQVPKQHNIYQSQTIQQQQLQQQENNQINNLLTSPLQQPQQQQAQFSQENYMRSASPQIFNKTISHINNNILMNNSNNINNNTQSLNPQIQQCLSDRKGPQVQSHLFHMNKRNSLQGDIPSQTNIYSNISQQQQQLQQPQQQQLFQQQPQQQISNRTFSNVPPNLPKSPLSGLHDEQQQPSTQMQTQRVPQQPQQQQNFLTHRQSDYQYKKGEKQYSSSVENQSYNQQRLNVFQNDIRDSPFRSIKKLNDRSFNHNRSLEANRNNISNISQCDITPISMCQPTNNNDYNDIKCKTENEILQDINMNMNMNWGSQRQDPLQINNNLRNTSVFGTLKQQDINLNNQNEGTQNLPQPLLMNNDSLMNRQSFNAPVNITPTNIKQQQHQQQQQQQYQTDQFSHSRKQSCKSRQDLSEIRCDVSGNKSTFNGGQTIHDFDDFEDISQYEPDRGQGDSLSDCSDVFFYPTERKDQNNNTNNNNILVQQESTQVEGPISEHQTNGQPSFNSSYQVKKDFNFESKYQPIKKQDLSISNNNNNNTTLNTENGKDPHKEYITHLVKRRLLFNNTMQKDNVKRESLDCKHDDMGRLIDEFGKFLFDNNGNPIEFNGEDIGYLKDLNLINIL